MMDMKKVAERICLEEHSRQRKQQAKRPYKLERDVPGMFEEQHGDQ